MGFYHGLLRATALAVRLVALLRQHAREQLDVRVRAVPHLLRAAVVLEGVDDLVRLVHDVDGLGALGGAAEARHHDVAPLAALAQAAFLGVAGPSEKGAAQQQPDRQRQHHRAQPQLRPARHGSSPSCLGARCRWPLGPAPALGLGAILEHLRRVAANVHRPLDVGLELVRPRLVLVGQQEILHVVQDVERLAALRRAAQTREHRVAPARHHGRVVLAPGRPREDKAAREQAHGQGQHHRAQPELTTLRHGAPPFLGPTTGATRLLHQTIPARDAVVNAPLRAQAPGARRHPYGTSPRAAVNTRGVTSS